MKVNPDIFRAFQHDNLQYKQSLYKLAIEMYLKEDEESKLASSLLFASIADYMGVHLLMSLREHVQSLSKMASKGNYYLSINKTVSGAPLNKIIDSLKDFSFPMRDEILNCMHIIKNARNELFHEMAMVSPDNIEKLLGNTRIIAEFTESLVGKIDLLYSNFPLMGLPDTDVEGSTV